MKNNTKKKKFLSVLMLLIFTGMALYLCPCDAKAASPSDGLVISSAMNHDCCDGMPNCPLKDRGLMGMNGFLESYSQNKTLTSSELLPAQLSFIDANGLRPNISHLKDHFQLRYQLYEDASLLLSQQPLFIQFQSLLI